MKVFPNSIDQDTPPPNQNKKGRGLEEEDCIQDYIQETTLSKVTFC